MCRQRYILADRLSILLIYLSPSISRESIQQLASLSSCFFLRLNKMKGFRNVDVGLRFLRGRIEFGVSQLSTITGECAPRLSAVTPTLPVSAFSKSSEIEVYF